MEQVGEVEYDFVLVGQTLGAHLQQGSKQETMDRPNFRSQFRRHVHSRSGNIDKSGVYSVTGTVMSGVIVLRGSATRRWSSRARPLPSCSVPVRVLTVR